MAVKAASIIGVASAGGSLSITWKDCGTSATHAKTTDVEPTSLELGTETAITGTGDLNKEVTGGTYDIELKAGGGLIDSHFTGNNCEAKDFNLPLGIGTLSWDGIACPLATGTTNIGFHTKLAAALPPALATSDIAVRSTDQDSEQLLCVDLHLAEQAALSLVDFDPMPDGKCCADIGCGGNCASDTWHKSAAHCGLPTSNTTCAPCIDIVGALIGNWNETQSCDGFTIDTVCGVFSKESRKDLCENMLRGGCSFFKKLFLAGGRDPAKMCSGLGACGSGSMCGCKADDKCIDVDDDEIGCCSGAFHLTVKCGTQKKCGCIPDDHCMDDRNGPEACCSGQMVVGDITRCLGSKVCVSKSLV